MKPKFLKFSNLSPTASTFNLSMNARKKTHQFILMEIWTSFSSVEWSTRKKRRTFFKISTMRLRDTYKMHILILKRIGTREKDRNPLQMTGLSSTKNTARNGLWNILNKRRINIAFFMKPPNSFLVRINLHKINLDRT